VAKAIDQEIKAAALADLVAGMSLHQAEKKYAIPRVTLRRWQEDAGVSSPVLPPEAIHDVGAALGRHMCAVLDVLTEQVTRTKQVDWLASHGVDGFARLYQTLTQGVAGVVAAQEIGAAEEEPTPIRRAS
jgi:hypothetical protein